jgi:hypothetical protein
MAFGAMGHEIESRQDRDRVVANRKSHILSSLVTLMSSLSVNHGRNGFIKSTPAGQADRVQHGRRLRPHAQRRLIHHMVGQGLRQFVDGHFVDQHFVDGHFIDQNFID